MNKSDIVDEIFYKTERISKQEINKVVDKFIEVVSEALVNNRQVNIRGLFTIKNKLVKGRKGVFIDGKPWKTKDKMAPKVSFSKSLKEAIKNEAR